MCPACLSAATIAALGLTSGGGIAAAVVVLRKNPGNGVRPRFRDFLRRRGGRAVTHPDISSGEEKPDAYSARDLPSRTTT
jgi:hypothetical protein